MCQVYEGGAGGGGMTGYSCMSENGRVQQGNQILPIEITTRLITKISKQKM